MATIKSVATKTGLSWTAVFMFALLFAFILYTASVGSLSKYYAFLFASAPASSSGSASTTSAPAASTSGSSTSSSSISSDLHDVESIAGIAAMFA